MWLEGRRREGASIWSGPARKSIAPGMSFCFVDAAVVAAAASSSAADVVFTISTPRETFVEAIHLQFKPLAKRLSKPFIFKPLNDAVPPLLLDSSVFN